MGSSSAASNFPPIKPPTPPAPIQVAQPQQVTTTESTKPNLGLLLFGNSRSNNFNDDQRNVDLGNRQIQIQRQREEQRFRQLEEERRLKQLEEERRLKQL